MSRDTEHINDDVNSEVSKGNTIATLAEALQFDITSSIATAEVSLIGGSATGNITVSVKSIFLPVAQRFEAVKFWMGFQYTGTFFVDDVLVTRKR